MRAPSDKTKWIVNVLLIVAGLVVVFAWARLPPSEVVRPTRPAVNDTMEIAFCVLAREGLTPDEMMDMSRTEGLGSAIATAAATGDRGRVLAACEAAGR